MRDCGSGAEEVDHRAALFLADHNVQPHAHILSVDVREPNLESVFLHLTGKSLRD